MSAPIISPVRGFASLGPYPPNKGSGEDVQRITLYLISPASHSASSVWIFTYMASMKPASLKAIFHAKTPSLI